MTLILDLPSLNKNSKIEVEASKDKKELDIIANRKISLFKPKNEKENKGFSKCEWPDPSKKMSPYRRSNNEDSIELVGVKTESFTGPLVQNYASNKSPQLLKEEALYVQFYRAVNSK